jgi:hypothetical protein
MKWLKNYLSKIRFEKSRRSDIYIEQIARDKTGKWVTDNESKLVYKNDDPKRIEKFTLLQEKKSETQIIKCCGGKDKCACAPDPVSKKPVAKKPTAKKKPAPKKK